MTSRLNKETHLIHVPMSCNICIVISIEKPKTEYAMINIKVTEVGTLLIINLENMYEYIPPWSKRI
jgi:hypothetical protein